MIYLPPIPSWDAFHPLIVHFPIALLLVAPLFVILGILLPADRGRQFLVAGFILMFLGSAGVFIAVETGEAAAKLVEQTPLVKPVLAQHQKFAETTLVLFSALTVAFAALLFIPRYMHRELDRKLNTELLAAFLLFYLTGVVFVVNTAHQGARLVHEFKITAPISAAGPSAMRR